MDPDQVPYFVRPGMGLKYLQSRRYHEQTYMLQFQLMLITILKNSEYDQEIPQSQTADNPVAPRGRAAQPSRDTRKTN